MASLRYTCGCVRYMSPTRLSNFHSSRQKEMRQVRWHSAPSSPSRLRTTTVTAAATQRFQRMAADTDTSDEIVSSSVSSSATDNSDTTESEKGAESMVSSRVNTLKGNLRLARDWTADNAAKLDPKAITKLLSVLNIDLPKYQRFLSGTAKMISFAKEDDIERIKRQQLEEKRARVMTKMDSVTANKESHDFEQAMMSIHDGVQNYYSSMPTSDSVDNPAPTAQSRQITQESTQASILNQVTKLAQILPGGEGKDSEKKLSTTSTEVLVVRTTVDRRTRGLVSNVKNASSDSSRVNRLQDLCVHLSLYTKFAKNVAIKVNAVPMLLKLRESSNHEIAELSNQALSLVGHVDPVKGKGIRILSIDGGGTRGLVALEMMRQLEAATGQPIHQMFDFICGVSTGSLIAAIVGIYKRPIDECERIYKKFSREMFDRSRLLGASKLVTTHAYYDTNLWENILKENVGLGTFKETMKDRDCPKHAMVSTLVNQQTMENFVFRNYTHTTGVQSKYRGSIKHSVWQGIRASSAAPGYYEEMKLGDHIHQDGGLLTNNPTAIAIHESKLLWPDEDIQCVVSLGTGRFRANDGPSSSYNLKDKILKVVQSATDTEAVHTVLLDLLPPSSYFRFNPYLSDEFTLDEIKEDRWEVMSQDSLMYCRKNSLKFDMAAKQLLLSKSPRQKAACWMKNKVGTMY